MLGFAEQLELIQSHSNLPELQEIGGKDYIEATFLKAARATCDFYIENTAQDGIPYWDTGAPGLAWFSDWHNKPSDPHNNREPVDRRLAVEQLAVR